MSFLADGSMSHLQPSAPSAPLWTVPALACGGKKRGLPGKTAMEQKCSVAYVPGYRNHLLRNLYLWQRIQGKHYLHRVPPCPSPSVTTPH